MFPLGSGQGSAPSWPQNTNDFCSWFKVKSAVWNLAQTVFVVNKVMKDDLVPELSCKMVLNEPNARGRPGLETESLSPSLPLCMCASVWISLSLCVSLSLCLSHCVGWEVPTGRDGLWSLGNHLTGTYD